MSLFVSSAPPDLLPVLVTLPLSRLDSAFSQSKLAGEYNAVSSLSMSLAGVSEHLNFLYTYRSLSRATPQSRQDWDESTRRAYYTAAFDAFLPTMSRLFNVWDCAKSALSTCILQFDHFSKNIGSGAVTSDHLYLALIYIIDGVLMLDTVKDAKACLNNDLSSWKRSIPTVSSLAEKRTIPSDVDLFGLAGFLSSKGCILGHLHGSIRSINGFESTMVALIEFCVKRLEAEDFVLPDEKHSMVRFMAYALRILDSNPFDVPAAVFGAIAKKKDDSKDAPFVLKKALDVDSLLKIFRRYPVVPVMGDITLNVSTIVSRCTSYSETEWSIVPRADMAKVFALSSAIPKFSNRFSHFILKMYNDKDTVGVKERDDGLLMEGLRFACSVKCALLEQLAWKYTQAAPNPEGRTVPVYDRVVRLNYDREERFHLVECVFLLRNLRDALSAVRPRSDSLFLKLQDTAFRQLPIVLCKLQKRMKEEFDVVREWCSVGGLFPDGEDGKDDWIPAKKNKPAAKIVDIRPAKVRPSESQLYLLQILTSWFVSPRNTKNQKRLKKKYLNPLEMIEPVLRTWPFLSRWSDCVGMVTDVSELWFREFYLELAHEIAFPIEMSLPWIIASEVVESESGRHFPMLFSPLQVYNDATRKSLYAFKKRHLYDELSVEANLVHEQLLYSLSEVLYRHVRSAAFFSFANANLLRETSMLPVRLGSTLWTDVLLSSESQSLSLLGRHVNVTNRVLQRLFGLWSQEIDRTIVRCERGTIPPLVLCSYLELLSCLPRFLYNRIDSFDSVYSEVSESSTRLLKWIVRGWESDVLKNGLLRWTVVAPQVDCMQSRKFDVPSWALSDPVWSLLFVMFDPYRDVLDASVVDSLYDVLTPGGQSKLAEYIESYIVSVTRDNFLIVLETLKKAYPDRLKIGKPSFGASVLLEAYELVFKSVREYSGLEDVMQYLKEVGNAIFLATVIDARRRGFLKLVLTKVEAELAISWKSTLTNGSLLFDDSREMCRDIFRLVSVLFLSFNRLKAPFDRLGDGPLLALSALVVCSGQGDAYLSTDFSTEIYDVFCLQESALTHGLTSYGGFDESVFRTHDNLLNMDSPWHTDHLGGAATEKATTSKKGSNISYIPSLDPEFHATSTNIKKSRALLTSMMQMLQCSKDHAVLPDPADTGLFGQLSRSLARFAYCKRREAQDKNVLHVPSTGGSVTNKCLVDELFTQEEAVRRDEEGKEHSNPLKK
eukprot:ANDGO_05113.mRNA.1 Cytoplasmic FMR1-interacting protein